MGRKVKGGKQQPQNKKTRRSGGGGEDQDGDSSDGQDRQQQQQQHLDDRMSEVTIESAPGDCNEDYEMPTTSASAATSQRLLLPAHLLSAFETLSNDSKKTSAAHRLTALNSLGNHVALSFAPNLLHSHSESVLPELIKSLRKSSSSSSSSLEECTAAAKLIALLFISGDDWIVEEEDKFHSSLLAAIRANTPSSSSSSSSSTAAMVIDTDTAAQLAACIDSLAILIFITHIDNHRILLDNIDTFLGYLPSPPPTSSRSTENKDEEDNVDDDDYAEDSSTLPNVTQLKSAAEYYMAAVNACALLISPLDSLDQEQHGKRLAPILLLLLQIDHTDLKISVAELVALLCEKDGLDPDSHQLLTTQLSDLAAESNRYKNKRENTALRAGLREIVESIERNDPPHTKLTLANDDLEFDSWARIIQLQTFRRYLGPGLPVHFSLNPFLHSLFEYSPPPLDHSSSSKRGAGKRKTSRVADKLRDKAIQQARGSKASSHY